MATILSCLMNTWMSSRCLPILFMACILFQTGIAAAAGLKIVTSFYPIYLATLNVAGNIPGVEVTNLTKPFTGCLHDYQMTPSDLVTLEKADIFVVNGAGMESFLSKAVQQVPRLKLIQASQGIKLIAAGDEANPHVWVSVSLHMQQVETIAAGLEKLDPDHAALYRKNAAAYLDKLNALRAAMRAGLQNAKRRDILTFHEAFPYFAREFDLRIVGVIEREPGSEPSARDLARIVALVKKTGVKAIFAEPQYSAKAADTIAGETGATVYRLDPVVTGPMTADAYLTIMQVNLRTLEQALGQ